MIMVDNPFSKYAYEDTDPTPSPRLTSFHFGLNNNMPLHMISQKNKKDYNVVTKEIDELFVKKNTSIKLPKLNVNSAGAGAGCSFLTQDISPPDDIDFKYSNIDLTIPQSSTLISPLQQPPLQSPNINKVHYFNKKLDTLYRERPKKRKIPKNVKNLVWFEYIGKNINTHKCLCCDRNEISYMNFHVGHVISEKDGGTDNITNLRPICSSCNLSMGTRNLLEFKAQYF